MREIGVGVIGCGIRGRHAYEHLLALHPAVRVKAVSHYPGSSEALREGQTTDRDRQHAQQFGAEFYGEDYERLLQREDVQIISLMVEPGRAAEFVERAAAAGKHILSDKPMAPAIAEGERIVAAVRRHGVEFLIAFNERYAPPLRGAYQRLASGGLGQLLTASVTYCVGGPLAGFTGSADYRLSFGGGEFANFGCYAADFLNWVAAARPVSVFAQMGTFFYEDYRSAGMDDLGECVVRYANGVIGYLQAGRPWASFPTPLITADLTAERGSVRVSGLQNWLEVTAGGYRRAPYGEPAAREMVHDFVEAIIARRPSPITAEDGLASLRIVQAAYQSARLGQPVQL